MEKCPCGSTRTYEDCCGMLISGKAPALTADQVMRARYSAYVKVELDYLFSSTHPHHRQGYDHKGTRLWAENSQWDGLEILDAKGGGPADSEGKVEFIASYREKGLKREYHELANFKKEEGRWYFTEGKSVGPKPIVRTEPKVGRNDPCPCGSGKKNKKCCGI
ncbi:MAG: YchJ family protein [Deltaproteobacteria bacterium]